jgi:hypothetical protein
MPRTEKMLKWTLLGMLLAGLAACSDMPDDKAATEAGPRPAAANVVSQPRTAAATASLPPATAARTADALIELERLYARALITKDRAFLESYYAPDFRGGNWMGFWTKSTMLKAVLDDRYSVKRMDLGNLQARIVGDVGIVQGVSDEVTSVNGRDTSGRWTFTDLFQWRDGRWQAIASQTSELRPGR